MNWFKIIIPLSITLGPHIALLSLLELSSNSKLEYSHFESNKKVQFTPVTMSLEQPAEDIALEKNPASDFLDQTAEEEINPTLEQSTSFEQSTSSTEKNINHPSAQKQKRRNCSTSSFVSQQSAQSYTLEEEQFNHLMSTPKEAYNLATLSWSTSKSGRIRGIKIKRIPCSSPLRAMGLTPGMLVTHINQKPIKSNTDLYKAYRNIKKSSSFT